MDQPLRFLSDNIDSVDYITKQEQKNIDEQRTFFDLSHPSPQDFGLISLRKMAKISSDPDDPKIDLYSLLRSCIPILLFDELSDEGL